MLYGALGECLALCQYVMGEGLEEELRSAVEEPPTGPRGKGSRKVKGTSDVFHVVCRFAFGNPKDRSSIVKYAQAIREAAARQISSHDLAGWLEKNGGTRALYLKARADGGFPGSRKTLHLNQPFNFPLRGPFTLVLQYDGKGFFDLLNSNPGRPTPNLERLGDPGGSVPDLDGLRDPGGT